MQSGQHGRTRISNYPTSGKLLGVRRNYNGENTRTDPSPILATQNMQPHPIFPSTTIHEPQLKEYPPLKHNHTLQLGTIPNSFLPNSNNLHQKTNDSKTGTNQCITMTHTENTKSKQIVNDNIEHKNQKALTHELGTTINQKALIHELGTTKTQKALIHELGTTKTQKALIQELGTTKNQKALIQVLGTTKNQKNLIHELGTIKNKEILADESDSTENQSISNQELCVINDQKTLKQVDNLESVKLCNLANKTNQNIHYNVPNINESPKPKSLPTTETNIQSKTDKIINSQVIDPDQETNKSNSDQEFSQNTSIKKIGIRNIGNSCHLNAVIQIITRLTPTATWFEKLHNELTFTNQISIERLLLKFLPSANNRNIAPDIASQILNIIYP